MLRHTQVPLTTCGASPAHRQRPASMSRSRSGSRAVVAATSNSSVSYGVPRSNTNGRSPHDGLRMRSDRSALARSVVSSAVYFLCPELRPTVQLWFVS